MFELVLVCREAFWAITQNEQINLRGKTQGNSKQHDKTKHIKVIIANEEEWLSFADNFFGLKIMAARRKQQMTINSHRGSLYLINIFFLLTRNVQFEIVRFFTCASCSLKAAVLRISQSVERSEF